MAERPWIILTLRRTGGTSLTTFLSQISDFPKIEHEPFNPDRKLGRITRAFRDTGDLAAMQAEVAAALADRPNIKHCVEIIPQEITRALIDACLERDYRFIVLTRRDEARRIGSLLLAMATGAWGPEEAATIYAEIRAGARTPDPIDLQAAINRARRDGYAVGRTLSLLRHRRIDFAWYLFEELYLGETPISEQARGIAADLGVTVAPDDRRLQAFARRDGQKSDSIAEHVPGYAAAMTRLRGLCAE